VPVLLPLGLAGFAAGSPSPAGWLVLAGVPLAVVTVIGSASRNAWLGLVLGLAILAGLAYRVTDAVRRRWIAGSAAAMLVLLALGFGLSTAAVSDRARALLDPAREPRLVLWRVAAWMFRESPLVGQGVHTFRDFHGPVVESLALPPGVVRDREVVPWA